MINSSSEEFGFKEEETLVSQCLISFQRSQRDSGRDLFKTYSSRKERTAFHLSSSETKKGITLSRGEESVEEIIFQNVSGSS
jgi:hypothetical protein